MWYKLKDYFLSLVSLVYPSVCTSCKVTLTEDTILCDSCYNALPKVNSHIYEVPFLAEKFYGRITPKGIYAFLLYNKKGVVQDLIFDLKYKNKPDIGYVLGKEFGNDLKEKILQNKERTVLVPVPLHHRKEKLRGYNQSLLIAQGIADCWKVKVDNELLTRLKFGESQTTKNRLNRWENLSETYRASNKDCSDKHLFLVDDILTTGATLEVCYNELQKTNPLSITLLSLAITTSN